MATQTDKFSEKIKELHSKINQSVEYEQLNEFADKLKQKTIKVVRQYPIPSLLGGLVVGIFLGKLFSGSGDE